MKTSLGPIGLDKMLVDEIGDVIVTNDGATILKQLEVEHPAAKGWIENRKKNCHLYNTDLDSPYYTKSTVLVELAQLQDQEVGDGTTSVVIIAAELLKRANELVKQKIHPTSIIAGFRIASKESVRVSLQKWSLNRFNQIVVSFVWLLFKIAVHTRGYSR